MAKKNLSGLTEWTLDDENRGDLQRLADSILVLSRDSEVVASVLDQVGDAACGARDRGGHQVPQLTFFGHTLLHNVVGDHGASVVLWSLPANDN